MGYSHEFSEKKHTSLQLENTLTPAVKENSVPTTTDFVEIKMTDHTSSSASPFKPDVVIRRGSVSIEISNTATEELLNKVGRLSTCLMMLSDLKKFLLPQGYPLYLVSSSFS